MLIAQLTPLCDSFPSDFTLQRGGTLTSRRRTTWGRWRAVLRLGFYAIVASWVLLLGARFPLCIRKSGWIFFADLLPGSVGETPTVGDGAVASGEPLLTSPPAGDVDSCGSELVARTRACCRGHWGCVSGATLPLPLAEFWGSYRLKGSGQALHLCRAQGDILLVSH